MTRGSAGVTSSENGVRGVDEAGEMAVAGVPGVPGADPRAGVPGGVGFSVSKT